jgi:adsorption protein B
MIGLILVNLGYLTEEELKKSLLIKPKGMRLGTWLVHNGQLTPLQLAQGLAEQANVEYVSVDAYDLSLELISSIPAEIALHYAILPISRNANRLVLATESALSPIALSALRRKLGIDIEYVIAEIGQVTVGLRHSYARHRLADPMKTLDAAIALGQLKNEDRQAVWTYYVSRQLMLGEVLQTLGRIDATAFSAVLLQHASSTLSLGGYLVKHGIISEDTLQHAIEIQKQIQPSIEEVIAQYAKASENKNIVISP